MTDSIQEQAQPLQGLAEWLREAECSDSAQTAQFRRWADAVEAAGRAPLTDEEIEKLAPEAAAIKLWEMFSPEHRERWKDEPHKGDYRYAAQAALSPAAPAAPAVQPQPVSLQSALAAPGCERLRDFYETGPVHRTAVESFVAAIAPSTVKESLTDTTDFPWKEACTRCLRDGIAERRSECTKHGSAVPAGVNVPAEVGGLEAQVGGLEATSNGVPVSREGLPDA